MIAIILGIAFKMLCWAVIILLLPFKALRFVFRKINQKIKEAENDY